jgi:hypothetical protein
MAANVGADHLLPPWPIVCPTIPDAQGMPDVLTPENPRKVFIIRTGRVIATLGRDYVACRLVLLLLAENIIFLRKLSGLGPGKMLLP